MITLLPTKSRNGLVIDVNKVAGFASHAVTSHRNILPPVRPNMYASDDPNIDPPTPIWRVAKLQLVSLLKYDGPKVYVSEFLPAMTELVDLEMRKLDTFEHESLEQLYDGKDLIRESGKEEIRMLGSLRATKNCMECHSASRGELLGAFSYRLVRQSRSGKETGDQHQ